MVATEEKVTKGHLKVKLVAGNWPLILFAIETIDCFEGLVTEIRDDDLSGMFGVGAQKFLIHILRPLGHIYFSFYRRVKLHNAIFISIHPFLSARKIQFDSIIIIIEAQFSQSSRPLL